jgi:hypothetical protein
VIVAPLHVTIGRPQTLNVEVFAAEESIYEWRLNGNLVSTGATAQLNLNPASTNETDLYQLIVRNAYGSATSAPVSVTILEPVILRTVFEKDFSKFEIHFDFPAAAEEVELEYSFHLRLVSARVQESRRTQLFFHRANPAQPQRSDRVLSRETAFIA